MTYKAILGVVAIVLTFVAFLPYIRSILRDKTKPHVFSWVIWGSTTFIVFLAQLADKGGAGAWAIGVSGIITIFIAALAYIKRSDDSITKVDWVFFLVAMSSIPLWYVTSDPLWAVVILTSVDVIGFGPTMRKAYSKPQEEQLTFFLVMALRNLTAIAALEHYSMTTILFPLATGAGCLILILMVLYRRRALQGQGPSG